MGESNKVLSVSYGTFSCRLEGFDDSVETMKAVVSYFHELAGNDRFMDMDPQAPDVDALAELAQEEDAAPVEVTTVAGAVSLRIPKPVEETQDSPSLRAAFVAPMPEDIAEIDEDADHPASEGGLVAEESSDLDDDLEQAPADDADDAETFADDDAAFTDTAVEDEGPVDEEEYAEADAPEAETEPVAEDEDEDDAPLAEVEERSAAPEMANDDGDDAAEIDETVAEETATDDTAQEITPFYDPAKARDTSEDGDSVAAKLERIRALVGRVPPANRGAPPPQAEAAAPTASITDRLSALTAKTEEDTPPAEDIVDGFEFKNEETAPLVLSDSETAEDEDADAPEINAEDTEADHNGATPDIAENDEEDGEEDDETAMRRLNQSKRANLPENDDDAMSRIMSQADERLSEPEGRRHRDAFAQLKAAVVATEAARQLGDREDDVDPQDAFREDLDEAVREGGDEDNNEGPAAVPLKLVAEQRIEDAPENPSDRLRQIASVKDDNAAPTAGFAEFAEEQGATELGDLLEAAAAYIAFVEGDADFSRPQVMKKVQLAATDEFSREDGLRSFGRLLRQSRIIKLNNGRFQVSEDTRFRPTDKAAQG